jgi:methyl-accepting chemotaxis protein
VSESSAKVGELVAEIATAPVEQAQGIDHVNKAVAEMDKVVQQNAANAQEAASASEEMNAQAEDMKSMVNGLGDIVGGRGNEKDRSAVAHVPQPMVRPSHLHRVQAPKEKAVRGATQVAEPGHVIALDDVFS